VLKFLNDPRSYTKYFGVKERMDGKGREIRIGLTNELSGKVMEVNV
jgi:hypothetical protein